MKTHRLVLAAVLLSFCIHDDAGATDAAADETIIVTATRTEIPLRDAIVPVTLISREDIELSLANDLAELLRFQAGIDIGRNGGPGQATSVFLRGTESNHTLVLIDGVRINPGTIGGAAVEHIAPEIIERVEIVKGARSALYGTDAIGGVINIITRRAQDAYVETSVGAGSFDTFSGYISGGNRGDNSEFGVTLNWEETDGYAPRVGSDIKRGYDNLTVNLYALRSFGNSELSIRHWQAEGTVEYLDFFLAPLDQDFKNSTTALEFDSRLSDRGTSKLVVSFMQSEIIQNQLNPFALDPDLEFAKSDRIGLDWQYSHALENHTLTGGLYAIDEEASSLSFDLRFDEDTSVRAAFLQDLWSHGRHRAFAAIRVTDHETFGKHTTWNAEYAYEFSDAWTLNAGLGHAFRAPDATDRFGFGGNPDLDPELADEAQIGLRYAPGTGHSVDIEFFSNDIEDLIEYEFDPETFLFTAANVARAEIRGAQLGYEYRGDRFTVHADFVKQQADDASTGQRLLRRAEETATLSYTQDIGTHRIGVSVVASGDREDFGGATLASYVLTNLSGQIRMGGSWALHARIENVLDEEYETAAGFRMQKRAGYVELKYRWN